MVEYANSTQERIRKLVLESDLEIGKERMLRGKPSLDSNGQIIDPLKINDSGLVRIRIDVIDNVRDSLAPQGAQYMISAYNIESGNNLAEGDVLRVYAGPRGLLIAEDDARMVVKNYEGD